MTERMRDFDANYADIMGRIEAAADLAGRSADEIHLLGAVKTVPPELIDYAITSGLTLIGDNRVQELLEKQPHITAEHEHHFIGHLQTNKVKSVIGRVNMIESVDSVRLAAEISKQSLAAGIVTDILIEVNIGREESKSGFFTEQLGSALAEIVEMSGIKVRGIMTIPPICRSSEENAVYFAEMQKVFIDISHKNWDNVSMDYLSMGMSDDFEQAIAYGANIIRIGTALFGARNYSLK